MKIIQDIIESFKEAYLELSEQNVSVSCMEALKKLTDDNIDLLKEIFDWTHIRTVNFKEDAKKFISIYDNKINEIKMTYELILFLKDYFSDCNRYLTQLTECKDSMKEKLVKDISLPENCKELLEMARFYSFVHKSVTFERFFKKALKCYAENAKELNLKDNDVEILNFKIEDMEEIFIIVKQSYEWVKNALRNERKKMSYQQFNEYFQELQGSDAIEKELKILTKIFDLDANDNLFVKDSLNNIFKKDKLNKLCKSLIDCLNIFNVKVDKNSSIKKYILNKFIQFLSQDDFDMVELNKRINEIEFQVVELMTRDEKDDVICTINELGKNKKLIEYLLENEEDIRNMIDTFDEYGDNHIGVQEIFEICKVSQFIKKIIVNNGEDQFIKSIINLIENEKDKGFKNISTLIQVSGELVDSIKFILRKVQNREEASKIKIEGIGMNAQFKIQFNEQNKSFDVTTYFKQKQLNINELY